MMNRRFVRFLAVCFWLVIPHVHLTAAAQTTPSAICVSAYTDTNGNGMRDSGEIPLAGVKVHLLLSGALIATHITDTQESFCFENLTPGIYTVRFASSPTYRITTSSEGTFEIASGQRLTIDAVGVVPIPSTWIIQSAPSESNAICVSTYEDGNANAQRDPDEPALAGINVNLVVDNVIIGTHLMASSENNYCFEQLSPDIYTVAFGQSPTERATTDHSATFALPQGQRLTLDGYGAVSTPMGSLRDTINTQIVAIQPADEPLTNEVRLMLATAGSMVVMIFMIGAGAVLVALVNWRRPRRKKPQPRRTDTHKLSKTERMPGH
ncbi:MAG TPA: SdrD B-like domain-containing protein [Aggregatilineaceae bacterium]|nr:SdrD B-like domain-containing protein [Aggregatilineaceae bacterium]